MKMAKGKWEDQSEVTQESKRKGKKVNEKGKTRIFILSRVMKMDGGGVRGDSLIPES